MKLKSWFYLTVLKFISNNAESIEIGANHNGRCK